MLATVQPSFPARSDICPTGAWFFVPATSGTVEAAAAGEDPLGFAEFANPNDPITFPPVIPVDPAC